MAEGQSGSADEQDLDEARNHLISTLSAHAAKTPDIYSASSIRDGSVGTKVSSSNADAGSSAASETLTESEVSFLSSLLNDPKVPPKYVKRASKRLSDVNLFPPPRVGDVHIVDDDGEEGPPRDHTLQEELFRRHERSGMSPSLVLKQLSIHSSIKSSVKSQRIRRSSRGNSGTGTEASLSSARIGDVKLASKNQAQGTANDENPVECVGANGKNKKTSHVVRHASHLSQGFEVMCLSAHSGASVGGSQARNASEGQGIKETRQIQFQSSEDGGLLLSGLDKLDDEATDGDLHSDAAIRPKTQTDGGGQHVRDDVSSWDLNSELHSEDDIYHHQPDAWDVLRDEYAWGYGFDGADQGAQSFKILGTSAEDKRCHPHVLSPPLMESLLSFMPETVADCNYFLKYSMVRDGSSLYQLLRNVRSSVRTVLAVETTEGYVFGSFTSAAWRTHPAYFGSHESFVWRMRRSRLTECHSVVEQAIMESELEVFPYTGNNNNVQLCHSDMIGLGGSDLDFSRRHIEDGNEAGDHDYGFALSFSSDLTFGNTSASKTFGSPCLIKMDAKGSSFKVTNIEVWSMTPFETTAEAEEDELARLFFFEEEEVAGKKLNIFKIMMGSPMRD